jgi:hypothetical protein
VPLLREIRSEIVQARWSFLTLVDVADMLLRAETITPVEFEWLVEAGPYHHARWKGYTVGDAETEYLRWRAIDLPERRATVQRGDRAAPSSSDLEPAGGHLGESTAQRDAERLQERLEAAPELAGWSVRVGVGPASMWARLDHPLLHEDLALVAPTLDVEKAAESILERVAAVEEVALLVRAPVRVEVVPLVRELRRATAEHEWPFAVFADVATMLLRVDAITAAEFEWVMEAGPERHAGWRSYRVGRAEAEHLRWRESELPEMLEWLAERRRA